MFENLDKIWICYAVIILEELQTENRKINKANKELSSIWILIIIATHIVFQFTGKLYSYFVKIDFKFNVFFCR